MSTALEARPRLSPDLAITRREHHGKVQFVVKEPKEQKYYQFGELEVGLMRLMDGKRTAVEICDAAEDTLGVRPGSGQVADFAQRLKRLGLVQRTAAEQNLMLMERLRAQRKVRAGRRSHGSLLRLRFSIGDPNELFRRVVQRIPWAWSPGFVVISVALFIAYSMIIAKRWTEFRAGVASLYTLSGFGPGDFVLFMTLAVVIGALHELGHGLTTRRFGGEVHEIGGMLLYFSPALFCNTNDAWTFERRSHRLWVTFAGPWVQLLIAAIGAVVWVAAEPGTLLQQMAFYAVLAGGITSVLANFNPLLPLDGYYALSDWLEIPNLRRRAFGYWGWLTKRYVWGIEAAPPALTPRERRVFLIYGGLALAYSVLIGVVSLVWLVHVFGRLIGPWVWLILVIMLARFAGRYVGRARALAAAAAARWRWRLPGGGRRAGGVVAGALVLLALPFVLPWTYRARGEFRVEALPRAPVRAQVPGTLDRLRVAEGDTVHRGEVIAALWNPDLESRLAEREAERQRLEVKRSGSETQGDLTSAAASAEMLGRLEQELDVLRARRDQLILRAPVDGIVLGYRLAERVGEMMHTGDLLAEVAAPSGRFARVRIPTSRAGELAVGQAARLRLRARPGVEYRLAVSRLSPAASGGYVEVDVRFPTDGWQPSPGMTGIAKIITRRVTVAQALARAVRQSIRVDPWL